MDLRMATSSRPSAVTSIDDLAFNVTRVGYDYGIPNRQRNQELNCASVRKLAGKLEEHLGSSKATCPSLDGTPQELGEAPENIVRVLWVSMWIEEGAKYTASALHKSKKDQATTQRSEASAHGSEVPSTMPSKGPRSHTAAAMKKGQEISNATHYTLLSQSPNAIRAVVPLGKKTATYYGLINLDKKTGLCEGILIPQDEIFHFAEFRNDKLVNKEERRQKWGRIIREKINKDTVSSVNNYDKSRFDVAPNLSLADEVVRLGTSYSITKGVEYLRYLRRLLEPYDDKDAHKWDSEKNGTIFKLMNPGPVLTLEEAQKAVEQLEALYPSDCRFDVTAGELQSVCQALRDAGIALDYREVGVFVSEFVQCLRIGMGEGKNLADLAKDTFQSTASRIPTDDGPRPALSNDVHAAVLSASHVHQENVDKVAGALQRMEDFLDDRIANSQRILDSLEVGDEQGELEDGQDEFEDS
ncbi:hypothetical protein SLS56_006169 [Neofusicoccum ribis]|uniref:Uncharacterized protein n=1 Tax=Neofusicoccum ribis TaxID=45134 RepID=A0ABR3SS22_9PEZI